MLSLAEMLAATADFTEKMGEITSRPAMKKFQEVSTNPDALSQALKGVSGEEAGKLFGVLNQLGSLQGKLSQIANLPEKDRVELIKQLRTMSQSIGSIGRTL